MPTGTAHQPLQRLAHGGVAIDDEQQAHGWRHWNESSPVSSRPQRTSTAAAVLLPHRISVPVTVRADPGQFGRDVAYFSSGDKAAPWHSPLPNLPPIDPSDDGFYPTDDAPEPT